MQGFLITIIIIVLRLGEVFCLTEEGPYEASVTNVSSCVADEQPSWHYVNITTYNRNGRNILRGSYAFTQELRDPKFHIQLTYMDGGTQVKAYEIKNQGCNSIIVRVVSRAFGLRYNSKTCVLKPTAGKFNVDINEVLHTLVHSLWYGSLQIHYEISKSTTLINCVDINVQIRKLVN